MKLSCEIIQDLLPLYCDGVCSLDSRQAVEEHLRDCGKCKADMCLMEQAVETGSVQTTDDKIAKAAAAAWKKGRTHAFIKGCLIALLSIAVLAMGHCAFHWRSSADGNDLDTLAQQAADYFNYGHLSIEKVERRGDYLAALCKARDGNWCMCVFDRDRLFENRWYANGGIKIIRDGTISSWNYGSPQREAVLIFCGGSISDEVCWYRFQNNKITYICPVEGEKVLDIFIIPDNSNIGGYPVLLDCN